LSDDGAITKKNTRNPLKFAGVQQTRQITKSPTAPNSRGKRKKEEKKKEEEETTGRTHNGLPYWAAKTRG